MIQQVIVVSGLPFTGKSHMLKKISSLPYFKQAVTVSMDQVRKRLFSDKPDSQITRSEHLYKNEEVRNDVLRNLVLGTPIIITEAVMLTRRDHQKPFVDMIRRANKYVQQIERERQAHYRKPHISAGVQLKMLLLYASPEIIMARASNSDAERNKSDASIFSLDGAWDALQQFQFPDPNTYVPLAIDTSDESAKAEDVRLTNIVRFCTLTKPESFSTSNALADARRYHKELCLIVSKNRKNQIS